MLSQRCHLPSSEPCKVTRLRWHRHSRPPGMGRKCATPVVKNDRVVPVVTCGAFRGACRRTAFGDHETGACTLRRRIARPSEKSLNDTDCHHRSVWDGYRQPLW